MFPKVLLRVDRHINFYRIKLHFVLRCEFGIVYMKICPCVLSTPIITESMYLNNSGNKLQNTSFNLLLLIFCCSPKVVMTAVLLTCLQLLYWSKVLTDQQGLCRFFKKHKIVKNLQTATIKQVISHLSNLLKCFFFFFFFFFQKKVIM